jgi:nucleotide-binding universal stress UspA family protein
MVNLKNLLIATDLSEASTRAVQEGFDLASRVGARVHLMHVVPAPLQEMWAGYVPASDFVDVLNGHKDRAKRQLAALAAKLARPDTPVEFVVEYGLPLEEVIAYAAEHQIDLIVCGTHRRRGLERVIAGSVAETLARQAPCPVLTLAGPVAPPAAAYA